MFETMITHKAVAAGRGCEEHNGKADECETCWELAERGRLVQAEPDRNWFLIYAEIGGVLSMILAAIFWVATRS